MAGYNRVIIVGNLTRDPELKQLASGQSVCRLGLAANRQYKNRQTGQMVQEVCYVDVDVWGAQADSCNQYLSKGRAALVEGRLKLDSWQDQEGNNRSKHSIVADRVVFLSSQQDADVSEPTARREQPASSRKTGAAVQGNSKKVSARAEDEKLPEVQFKDEPPFEDDLPF
ncbi:single-stranded DNA-binding protein [bacterium]|nr:single-stranded DNA-binding protein [bacterium]MBT3903897.1 single-stranded DNA-binding protein [bacterium]MBT4577846.1 single-stranded DNA-binding protein [bacterium]MBT5346025.1 single-stranded DNA-binding protein [bacterium]MBT6131262.1 single-stranded DNA-binding protein [bacterium]